MPCINIKQHFHATGIYTPIDKLTTVGYWVWKYKFCDMWFEDHLADLLPLNSIKDSFSKW